MKPITIIQTRVVLPKHLNDQNVLFGGEAMKWMDEVAYISARSYTNQPMVTISVETIKFLFPINQGNIIVIKSGQPKAGNVKLKIPVCIYRKNETSGELLKAVEADFYLVAVDNDHKPVRLRL